jgi:hypothetical protein
MAMHTNAERSASPLLVSGPVFMGVVGAGLLVQRALAEPVRGLPTFVGDTPSSRSSRTRIEA